MGYTCVLCVIIVISFCHESMGKNIFLTVYRNGTGGKRYDSSSNTIGYNIGDFVRIVCTANGEKLSWDSADTSSLTEIEYRGTLQKSQDGVEKTCHTPTNDRSISFTFVNNNNKKQAKPNLFKILLLGLGGVIAAALLLLSGYALLRCCINSRNKHREISTDVPLEAPLYAQIDNTMKKQRQEEPDYCEVSRGIDNVSCKIEETAKPAKPNIIDSPAHSENFNVKTDSSMTCVNVSDVNIGKDDSHDNITAAASSAAQETYPRSVKIVQNQGNAQILFKHDNVNEELKKRLTSGKFESSSDC